MPVFGAVAAMAGAACDIDDPAAARTASPGGNGESGQVRRRLQIDLEGAAPCGMPFIVAGAVGDGFENPGIIDEDVDSPAQFIDRGVPDAARRGRVGKVAGNQRIAAPDL